jgi:hypothetical protein
LNIYGAGIVSINQIGLDNVSATTKTKNFNIRALDDLSWKNAGNYLPVSLGT